MQFKKFQLIIAITFAVYLYIYIYIYLTDVVMGPNLFNAEVLIIYNQGGKTAAREPHANTF